MTRTSSKAVTRLLVDWSNGNQAALDELMPLVYGELRRLAKSYMRRERADHTLQPTALVNEAYLKLIDQRDVRWKNRAHFFGIAAQFMRRILVDHARQHNSAKRSSEAGTVSIEDVTGLFKKQDVDLVALDDALKTLADVDPQQSKVVEIRYFGGLSIEETAEVLGISPATVKREWSMARAWLHRELKNE